MPLAPRAALPLLALAALPLTACASAPPPASAAAAAPEPMPSSFRLDSQTGGLSDVDGEMMKIAKSEEDIDRLFPHAGDDKAARKAAPSAPAKAADAPAKAAGAAEAKKDEGPASGDPCATACSALASMRSSAEHLCKLAGESDGRCDDARGRVRGASARVRSVCPACSAAASDPGK
jgi:hypothetical protein